MTKRYSQVYNTGPVNQAPSETPLTPSVALVLGQIVGMRITVSALGQGSLSPTAIIYGLSNLEIDDANQTPLMNLKQNPSNTRTDLALLSYILSPRGTWTGYGPSVTTSWSTANWVLYAPFALARQPLYIKPTIAPYSVWGSGATGGQVSVAVDVITDDAYTGTVKTLGLKSLELNLDAGDNVIGDKLDKSAPILDIIAFSSVGDGPLNKINFRSGKEIELQDAGPGFFTAEDAMLTVSGHQSGVFNLRNTPFRATPTTYLDINVTSVSPWVLYELEQVD